LDQELISDQHITMNISLLILLLLFFLLFGRSSSKEPNATLTQHTCNVVHAQTWFLLQLHAVLCSTGNGILSIYLTIACNCSGMRPRTSTYADVHPRAWSYMHVCGSACIHVRACALCEWGIKPCPHCRRKVRLLPFSRRFQRRSPFSATVSLFCYSHTFLWQSHFSTAVWSGLKASSFQVGWGFNLAGFFFNNASIDRVGSLICCHSCKMADMTSPHSPLARAHVTSFACCVCYSS